MNVRDGLNCVSIDLITLCGGPRPHSFALPDVKWAVGAWIYQLI